MAVSNFGVSYFIFGLSSVFLRGGLVAWRFLNVPSLSQRGEVSEFRLHSPWQHIHHTSQDAEVLPFRNFQPDKVGNVPPDTGMAAQALKDAALGCAGSRRKRSTKEGDQREMSLTHLLCPCNKSLA